MHLKCPRSRPMHCPPLNQRRLGLLEPSQRRNARNSGDQIYIHTKLGVQTMVATASIAYDTGRIFMRCLRISSVALYDITTVVIKTRVKSSPVHRHYGVDLEEGSATWTHHIGTLTNTGIEAVPLGEKCSFFSRSTQMGGALFK